MLPPAIAGEKSTLSQEAKAEIQRLMGHQPRQYLTQVAFAWGVIFAAVCVAELTGTLWATGIAILIVATRMNILGLLVHEQAHFLGMRGRFADLAANMMAAYPLLLLSIEGYARVHLSHHRWYFTEKDPDLKRKSGPDWTFPMPGSRLVALFFADITGLSIIKLVRGKRLDSGVFPRPHPIPSWVHPCFVLTVFGVVTYFAAWKLFLIYWIVPLIFVFPAIVRLGAITEHVYVPGAGVAETSPLLIQKWYEKLLLPNLNFTMHLYHHWHPGVAWCHLPDVHRIYVREGKVNEAHIFRGYLHYLRHLQTVRPRSI